MSDRVVVIGSGYAGVTAVQRLESADDVDASIVWISDQPYHFVLHAAHKLITDPDRRDRLTVSNTKIADESTRVVEARVTGVEAEDERIVLNDGRKIAYDHLIIGIGSRTATYGIPGVLDHGYGLKGRRDAMKLATALREETLGASYQEPANVVVGGAGLSGIQLAGEVAEFRDKYDKPVNIHLVEALDDVFPNAPQDLQNRITDTLREKGVRIYTEEQIERVDANETLTSNYVFDHDVFIWTGGVTGPEELGNSPLPTDDYNRLQVKQTLETRYDNVYGVGDAAIVETQEIEPTAQAARQAGKVAGENVLRHMRGEQKAEWEYINRGTLINIGDEVIAHGVPYSPLPTFSGHPARALKRSITESWIESLTAPVSFFDLLPGPVKGESARSRLPF